MRLIDCYAEFLIRLHGRFAEGADLTGLVYDTFRAEVGAKLKACDRVAQDAGVPEQTRDAARFAAVAWVDELVLCSNWSDKPRWQQMPLQREYYRTTNAGAELYVKLEALGEGEWGRAARELYYFCMALGFRGRYFGDRRFAEFTAVKHANLKLLLPDGNLDLQAVTLFPEAYAHARAGKTGLAGRWNVLPWVFATPVAALLVLLIIYHHLIAATLSGIQALVR
ncbi:MAG TPA: DotU family type IV/VI secretion system protein [Gammaproteobacteria bacterium]|nr:DotU family type IV/VI secretion system protein [Gammaproteobacteria bacterium]